MGEWDIEVRPQSSGDCNMQATGDCNWLSAQRYDRTEVTKLRFQAVGAVRRAIGDWEMCVWGYGDGC